MLLKVRTLQGIVAGEIDSVFRRWKRPTVKAGGTLRTRVGVIAIDSIEPVSLSAIRASDARRAGHESKQALIDELEQRDGTVYRIEVRFAGADPRITLRTKVFRTKADAQDVLGRLARSDRAGGGPWTHAYLRLIHGKPAVRAEDLAYSIGMQKKPFKQRVRRLKELGLTESLAVGYRLSPRGRSLLRYLPKT